VAGEWIMGLVDLL